MNEHDLWIDYDLLNFLGRDHKNVTCTLVSDSAGMNHRLGLQSALHVKCTEVEWCSVANL